MILNEEEDLPVCRICLQEYHPISSLPCQCKGSLSFVHEECLNEYMQMKLEQGDVETLPNGVRKVKCDVCRSLLDVEVEKEVRWDRLPEISIELFLIVFVILCLGLVGLQLAEQLVKEAFKHNTDYI